MVTRPSWPGPALDPFAWLDALRRWRGRQMDETGLGPVETPWREAARAEGVRVRDYGGAAGGPVLLIVPAPVKQPYIWDLQPDRSVVRRALEAGFRVCLAEWAEAEEDAGLEEHVVGRLGFAAEAAARLAGVEGVVLAGNSLGGTMAALLAAAAPERVRGLLLVEAPLRFATPVPSFRPLIAAAPAAPTLLHARRSELPGSLVDLLATAAEPWPFVAQRWLDGLRSLPEPGALATFARVYRWTLDEFPVPGALVEDVAERLYGEDAFCRGTLTLAGRRLGPERLEAPTLAIVNPASRLVPPEAVLPFLEAARCRHTAVVRHGEEVGVALQHVGALVGARAHAAMWPAVMERLRAWWEGRAPAVPLPETV